MSLALLSSALLSECDLGEIEKSFDTRKATRNMKMALACTNLALARLPEQVFSSLKSHQFLNLVTVLGTSLGELEVTKDFLLTWETSKLARPLLFQNSLYNATLGYVSMQCGLQGPALTVSHNLWTAEDTIEIGDLLATSHTPFVLTVCVDGMTDTFRKLYTQENDAHAYLTEGAAAAIWIKESCYKGDLKNPLVIVEKIQRTRQTKQTSQQSLNDKERISYYHSDGLEQLLKMILSQPNQHRHVLTKINGDSAEIQIRELF